MKTAAIYDGQVRLGRIVLRGKASIEAFDGNDNSLGVFTTEKEAANAVAAVGRPLQKEDENDRRMQQLDRSKASALSPPRSKSCSGSSATSP